jgi:hypothetical protein
MSRKLDNTAFDFYVGLGLGRSYKQVGEHFGANKRTVVRTAIRENWQERLEAIEQKSREAIDERLATELQEMQVRHLKLLRAMGSRAAKAVAELPLNTGMEGIRAAETVIKLERLLAGEPGEATALTVARVTKDEVAKLITTQPEEADEW